MAFSTIPKLIEMFRDEGRYNKDLVLDALSTVNDAIIATRKYEVSSEGKTKRNRKKELNIAHLWSEASFKTTSVSDCF